MAMLSNAYRHFKLQGLVKCFSLCLLCEIHVLLVID